MGAKKWVQAENGRDEKLDVWVSVEDTPPAAGTLTINEPAAAVALLDAHGRPLHPASRRFGFAPPEKR